MKILKSLAFVIALAALPLFSCTKDETEPDGPGSGGADGVYDEDWYASNASVSSDDPLFTAGTYGWTVSFPVEGGQVVVNVGCGTGWTVVNSATDLFETVTDVQSGTLTITAHQNTVGEMLATDITLITTASRIVFATISLTQEAYLPPEISVGAAEVNLPAVGETTARVRVESSLGEWDVESAPSWLTWERTSTGISITAEDNEDRDARNGRVVLSVSDGLSRPTVSITVSQDGRAYVEASAESLPFASAAGSTVLTVTSNYDWVYAGSESWIIFYRDGDELTVTVRANSSDDSREGVITLTAGDGAENLASLDVVVSQLGQNVKSLILVYNTISANREVSLPICGEVSCLVDWGDGSVMEYVGSEYPNHTYSKSGTYSVSISGRVTAISNERGESKVSDYIRDVTDWGNTGLTNMFMAFTYCSSIMSLPADYEGAFADVEDFGYAFWGCSALTTIPSGLFTYATKATKFNHVFYGCTSLTALPAGLLDNCTEAEQFYASFYNCTSLKSVGAGLFDNCRKCESVQWAFGNCSSLASIPDGLFDNCPLLWDFEYAFDGCSSLGSIPSGLFDKCPEATTFRRTFAGCGSLKSVPEGLFDHNTKVETFYGTFYQCGNLESVPEGLFANCPDVTVFQSTFWYCSNLKSIPEGLFRNNVRVWDFTNTFAWCESLTSIPEDLFASCPEVTEFYATFSNCKALESIPANLFVNNTKVKEFVQVFTTCALTSIPEGLFRNCTEVETFTRAFDSNPGLTSIPADLFSYCPEVTTFSMVFYHDTGLVSIPENLFANNKKVDVFRYAFEGCTALTGASAYDMVDGRMVHLYERTADLGYVVPTSTSACYDGCAGLDDYNDIPSSWK